MTVKDAKDLPAADRSGTSDPYIVFTFNNENIYKTQTIKENLNPVYDERFEVQIVRSIVLCFIHKRFFSFSNRYLPVFI